MDELVVDISPLRNPLSHEDIVTRCLEECEGGEIEFQGRGLEELSQEEDDEILTIVEETSPWETRPIYQLPPYCVSWELERSHAKDLGKKFASLFDTIEGKKTPSKKPVGVKPGKGRRHGGYGIG